MQTFKKSERLCTFRLKELLFNRGQRFSFYPFRIFLLCLEDNNLEPIFFRDDAQIFEGQIEGLPESLARQNPSWPFRKLPPSAAFTHPVKVMISISKRNFKKAADRNLIKRRIKEAYRKNKQEFYVFLKDQRLLCLLAIVYSSSEILPYREMEEKIVLTLQKLRKEIEDQKQARPTQE